MNLLESLLDAISRLNGDALVMHVGEKPYVVTTSEVASEFRGPLEWGQVELSSRVLTFEGVTNMLGHILPPEQRQALDEYGATEFDVAARADQAERFVIVAARGGEDIWIEIRRRTKAADGVRPDSPASGGQPAAANPAVLEKEHADGATVIVAEDPSPDLDFVPPTVGVNRETLRPSMPMDECKRAPALRAFDLPDDVGVEADIRGLLSESAEAAEIDISFMETVLPDHDLAGDDWPDEVMTETELTELLRAPAVGPRPAEAVGGGEARAAGWPELRGTPYVRGVDLDAARETPAEFPAASDAADADRLVAIVSAALVKAQEARDEASAVPPDERLQGMFIDAIGIPADDHGSHVEQDAGGGLRAIDLPVHPEEVVVHDDSPRAGDRPAEHGHGGRAAVVVPLARPSRLEESSEGRGGGSAVLQRLFHLAAARGAAAVYFVAQSAPLVRVDGEFGALEGEPTLTTAFVDRLIADLHPERHEGAAAPSEWLVEVPDIGRVRCITFADHRGPGLICRMVPPDAVAAEQLGLPAEVQALCAEADGLVLVGGGRRSGRSTLLTCFVDLINRSRSDHVITIESEIGFVHGSHRGFVSQREVRGDGEALAAAVRAAIREEPDVLVIEELRTPEVVWLALEAAESGCLVFGTVPSVSAMAIVDRVIEMFPAERREKARVSLAGALRGVVSQVLLRRMKGGRVAAREILLNNPAVSSLILEGRTAQLPAALEEGRRAGMLSFAESLAALVRDGTVHLPHACRNAPSREHLLTVLRRDGIDVAPAERLG